MAKPRKPTPHDELAARYRRDAAKYGLPEATVHTTHGSVGAVHTVDSESPTFGKDLERVFQINVAKARRDNKRIVGVADFVPRKGPAADPVDPRGSERVGQE